MNLQTPEKFLREQQELFKRFMNLPDDNANWDDFFKKNASPELLVFFEKRRIEREKLEEQGIII